MNSLSELNKSTSQSPSDQQVLQPDPQSPSDQQVLQPDPSSPSVIIVGSGPAGWTAAIYLARAGLEPWLFEGELDGINLPGGQLMTTTEVENYPGFPSGGVSGWDLMDRLKAQGIEFGTVLMPYRVTKITKLLTGTFMVDASNQKTYVVSAIILATGATAKYLGIASEKLYMNRGVSACATCDGALPRFRNKPIVVVGGGDTALEEALFLTKFGSQVLVIHRRDKFRASPIMVKRTLSHAKIRVIWNSVVEEIIGSDTKLSENPSADPNSVPNASTDPSASTDPNSIPSASTDPNSATSSDKKKQNLENPNNLGVTAIKLKNVLDNSIQILPCSGVFIAIGHQPNSELVTELVDVDSAGYIQTLGKSTATKTAGLFACGDVMDNTYRQAITAAGSGCSAAIDCTRYLQVGAEPPSRGKPPRTPQLGV